MTNKTLLSAALLALTSATPAAAQQAALTPTMGWSSWNTYAAKISESIIKGQADALVAQGLDTVGYRYLNIDDGFFYNRDADGHLVIHPTRFPNGLKPVVDYIHGLGLKAGIYTDAGHSTCASYYGGETGGLQGGIYEHEDDDCLLYFDSLAFDFIKVDFCGGTSWQNSEQLDLDPQERYTAIAQAIRRSEERTGRRVVYNVCRWDFPGTWVTSLADSWRTTQDINASWSSVKDIIGQNLYLSAYCSPGHYNDMDMLEVGRGLTTIEDRTHFGMWCILSSPLLIGCDLSSLSTATRNLLANQELIALNQDSLGLQAYVVQHTGDTYVLVKDIEQRGGLTRAAALYNPSDKTVQMSLDMAEVDLGGEVTVRDLISKKTTTLSEGTPYSVYVAAHGACFLRLTATQRLTRTRYEAETAYLSAYQELVNNQVAKTAIYSSDEACSGREKVGWLGMSADNDLQWRHVCVPEAGDYTLTLSYLSGEDRNIYVQVNGTDTSAPLTCNSGSWTALDSVSLTVSLQKGDNVVRLYNPSAWMPDIDCMTLSLPEADAIGGVPAQPSPAPSASAAASEASYDLSGRPVDAASFSGIYVKNGEKRLKR